MTITYTKGELTMIASTGIVRPGDAKDLARFALALLGDSAMHDAIRSMTINKQACEKLKAAAAKANDEFDPNMFVMTRDILALMDELEAKEERNEDILRQARSFSEAHDAASEIIRKLERNKPVVALPTTKLWAGKIACYEASDVISALTAAGIIIKVGE